MLGVDTQYYAQITFAKGDLWRFRVGGVYEDCVELSGAFGTKAQMEKVNPDDPYTNYVVNEAGTYEIFVKYYTNTKWGIYVADIGEEPPVPPVTDVIVSVKASVAQTDGAWIALWAWTGSGAGKFYFATSGGYEHDGTWVFNLPAGTDHMIVLRMASGAEVTDVTKWPDGKVWNQTGNISITGTEYTLSSIMDGSWTK